MKAVAVCVCVCVCVSVCEREERRDRRHAKSGRKCENKPKRIEGRSRGGREHSGDSGAAARGNSSRRHMMMLLIAGRQTGARRDVASPHAHVRPTLGFHKFVRLPSERHLSFHNINLIAVRSSINICLRNYALASDRNVQSTITCENLMHKQVREIKTTYLF